MSDKLFNIANDAFAQENIFLIFFMQKHHSFSRIIGSIDIIHILTIFVTTKP